MGAAVLLAGCASTPLFTARDEIHGFLVAVRDNDQARFDALVNQENLGASVANHRCRVQAPRGDALVACVQAARADPPVPLNAFRGIASSLGYGAGRRSSGPVGLPLKPIAHDEICLRKQAYGDCLLFFTELRDGWRLTGIADLARLDSR